MRVRGPLNLINWNDVTAVIEYCKKLGPTCCVIKHPNRANYNIVHIDRHDLLKGVEIVYKAT